MGVGVGGWGEEGGGVEGGDEGVEAGLVGAVVGLPVVCGVVVYLES